MKTEAKTGVMEPLQNATNYQKPEEASNRLPPRAGA